MPGYLQQYIRLLVLVSFLFILIFVVASSPFQR